MQESHVVAEVLQLAQVVRCDDGRERTVAHIADQEALDRLTRNGVQPVEGFITEKILAAARQSADNGTLTLHPLGKGLDFLLVGKRKRLAQLTEACAVEARVDGPIIVLHGAQRCILEEIQLVGNEKAALLDGGILPNGLAVDGHPARIGLEHAGKNTHKGGFSRTVRADKAEYTAVAHLGADIPHRRKAVEGFGHIRCTNHIFCFLSQKIDASAPSARTLLAVPQRSQRLAQFGGGERKQLAVMHGLGERSRQLLAQSAQRA